MNFTTLGNSIQGILNEVADGISSPGQARDTILSIVMVETWTHKSNELLYLTDLTDQEYRVCHTWALNNRHSYSNRVRCIRDMREVFPGLGLSAANKLVP